MLKPLIVAAALPFCTVAIAEPTSMDQKMQTTQTIKKGRSWEECNQIAIERGLRHGKSPERYQTRQGFGEPTTQRQGLIARCMAGDPI